MTLCIAAIAKRDKRIVTVSDHMLTVESISMTADVFSTSKVTLIGSGRRWISLFAGETSVAAKINSAVSVSLGNAIPTAAQVQATYKHEVREALKEKMENEFLSIYGMSRDQFVEKGRAAFGDEEFTKMKDQMRKFHLGTDFLVGGFDENGRTYLFSVNHPGVITSHEQLGFHAVGTGDLLANASLFFNFIYANSLAEVVYRLAEAKFRGEAAPGVGKATTICILGGDKGVQILPSSHIAEFERLWKEHGQSLFPPGLDGTLEFLLNNPLFPAKTI
jgi:hypothetical protein